MKNEPFSQYHVEIVNKGIKETQALITKEMRYSPDLRKQEYLTRLNGHLAYLENLLISPEDQAAFVNI